MLDDGRRLPCGDGWTAVDTVAAALLVLLALIPRTINLLGLDPFVDEAAWTDWAFRLFELTAPRTWLIPLVTDGRPPLFVWLDSAVRGVRGQRHPGRPAGGGDGRGSVGGGDLRAWARAGLTDGRGGRRDPLGAEPVQRLLLADRRRRPAADAAGDPDRLDQRLPGPPPDHEDGRALRPSLALVVWAKTTGIMLAVAPPLAIVMLGRPLAWRAYVRPLGAAFVAGLVVSAPLLLGVMPLLQQVAIHTGSADNAGRDLLGGNLVVAAGWMETFVGNRFLLLVGGGLVLALLFRQWALVFVGLLGGCLTVLLLDVTTPLFARYMLFLSFPAYLLAAYPIERASRLACWLPLLAGLGRRAGQAGGRRPGRGARAGGGAGGTG